MYRNDCPCRGCTRIRERSQDAASRLAARVARQVERVAELAAPEVELAAPRLALSRAAAREDLRAAGAPLDAA